MISSINPIFELLRNDGSIVVNKALMHRIGVNETIIYAELVSRYAYFNNEDMLTNDGYFYNTVDDLQLATALGEKAQNTAIKTLIKLGLIDKKLKGAPARRHFKIIDNMQLILSLIEEGKSIIKELNQKQKERMKQKIQYSKFSSCEKTELEITKDNINNSSSSKKTELSKINTSDNMQEVVENISVPPKGSIEFLQKDVCSSAISSELIPATGRRNNTNTIILDNNIKNNKGDKDSLLSLWIKITKSLKKDMTEVSYNTWIACIEPCKIEGNTLTLKVPNSFTRGILEDRFRDKILKVISEFENNIGEIDFCD